MQAVVRIFAALDLQLLLDNPGYRNPLRVLSVSRAADVPLEVQFVRGGVVVDPDPANAGLTVRWIVKTNKKFDEDPPLVFEDVFVKSGTGASTLFTATVNYATTAMNAALGINPPTTTNDVAAVTAMAELSWTGIIRGKTLWIPHTVNNDLYKGSETPPPASSTGALSSKVTVPVNGVAIAITGISVADPTQVTAVAHGLATNDTVAMTGVTGNTPSLNSNFLATVLDADNFTVPLDVTVAGAGGTAQRVAPGTPGDFALENNTLYLYTGDGSIHSWSYVSLATLT